PGYFQTFPSEFPHFRVKPMRTLWRLEYDHAQELTGAMREGLRDMLEARSGPDGLPGAAKALHCANALFAVPLFKKLVLSDNPALGFRVIDGGRTIRGWVFISDLVEEEEKRYKRESWRNSCTALVCSVSHGGIIDSQGDDFTSCRSMPVVQRRNYFEHVLGEEDDVGDDEDRENTRPDTERSGVRQRTSRLHPDRSTSNRRAAIARRQAASGATLTRQEMGDDDFVMGSDSEYDEYRSSRARKRSTSSSPRKRSGSTSPSKRSAASSSQRSSISTEQRRGDPGCKIGQDC
ncbi:hypothetical protein CF326_g9079, partial [Tilletia indica]